MEENIVPAEKSEEKLGSNIHFKEETQKIEIDKNVVIVEEPKVTFEVCDEMLNQELTDDTVESTEEAELKHENSFVLNSSRMHSNKVRRQLDETKQNLQMRNMEKRLSEMEKLVESISSIIVNYNKRLLEFENHLKISSETNSICNPAILKSNTESDTDNSMYSCKTESEEEILEDKLVWEDYLRTNAVVKCTESTISKTEPLKVKVKFKIYPLNEKTSLEELEKQVRNIKIDGVIWKKSKTYPLAYTIRYLYINCIINGNVSVDILKEAIERLDNYIQSARVTSVIPYIENIPSDY